MKLAFIDIETTGLTAGYHQIIEIAIITEHNGAIDVYCTRIKPNDIHRADKKALQINGYNEIEWIDAPYDYEVVDQIAEKLNGCTLVGHNVQFDHEFIEDLCWRHKVKLNCKHRMIDTVTLAHEHLYFVRSHSLDSIREFFGMSSYGSHRALKDCHDMRLIYYKLLRASAVSRLWWRVRDQIKKTLSSERGD
jgi:DNA polymerase III epsilon subunit-like protein